MRAELLVLVACSRAAPDEPIERLPPASVARPLFAPERPAPPPPPPPPDPRPQPPPAAVTRFLAAHAGDPDPWTGRAGHPLTPAQATELARRLAEDRAYVDGDTGCEGNPVPYELARGGERFTFAEDCGHMKIAGDLHAAIFSPDMIQFLRDLSAQAREHDRPARRPRGGP